MNDRAHFLQSQGLPPHCDAAQFSGSVVCPCGVKFDTNDPAPRPLCPLRFFRVSGAYAESIRAADAAGIAAQPLTPRQVSQAQRRLARLYSEPYKVRTLLILATLITASWLAVIGARCIIGH